jgi:hypothetical protein
MLRELFVIFSIALCATADLTFKMEDKLHSGANIPYPKNKVPGAKDRKGEDAFSVSPKLLTVNDGVGGSKFSAYFASKGVSLASQQYGIRMVEDPKLVPSTFDNFQNGFETSIAKFFYAYKKVVAEYVNGKNQSSEREAQLVELFSELVSSSDPINQESDLSSIDIKDLLFRDLFSISTTAISVVLCPTYVGPNFMLIYKKGDSLLIQLRPVLRDNYFILELIHSVQDNSSRFNSPDAIRINDLNIKPNEDPRVSKNHPRKKYQASLSKNDSLIPDLNYASEHDILIAASDGLFDNLPSSMIVVLSTAIVSLNVECYCKEIDCTSIINDEVVKIMISYFQATTSHKQITALTPEFTAFDYLNHPNSDKKTDNAAFQAKTEYKFNPEFDLSDCGITDIFYLKPIKEKGTAVPWITNCIRSLLSHHYPIRTTNIKIIAETFGVIKMSDYIAKAAKIVTLMDEHFNRHNKFVYLFHDITQTTQHRHKLDAEARNLYGQLSMTNEEINGLDRRVNEIVAMDNPTLMVDELAFIQEGLKLNAEKFQATMDKFKSVQTEIAKANEKLSGVEEQVAEIMHTFIEAKNEIIKKGITTLAMFEFVESIATQSGLITQWPRAISPEFSSIMEYRVILSTFNIRKKLFEDFTTGTETTLKYGAKPDDITVVATIVEKDANHVPQLGHLKTRLQEEVKDYAKSLLKSVRLWMNHKSQNQPAANILI